MKFATLLKPSSVYMTRTSFSNIPQWAQWSQRKWKGGINLSLIIHAFNVKMQRYFNIQSTLLISKSNGTLQNTSRYPYLDISDLRKWGKQLIEQPHYTNEYVIWLLNRNIFKILWKRGEIAPKEQFLLFSTIFCYLLLDFHVKTRNIFSLRDKRLFEISEFEITRVDCIFLATNLCKQ